MFTWMRTHQRKLMLIVTILTIIAFIVLYNQGGLESVGRENVATVYGRPVSIGEAQRQARSLDLALKLGLLDYVRTLAGDNGMEDASDYVFNSLVLEHEARELGIAPSQTEIKNAIAGMRVFQTDGQFDPKKYVAFAQENLAPRGFTETQIEQIVSESLVLDRLRRIIESPVVATDAEIRFANRAFQPVTGQAILFDPQSYVDKVKVTDDEIQAFYEQSKSRLIKPEVRTVRFVSFELPEEAKKLEGKEKVEALQKIADQSAQFADAAVAQGFERAAKDAGHQIRTSLDFNSAGQIQLPEGITNTGESLAEAVRALAPAAFTLTAANSVSGVVQDGDTFYVAELLRETPSRDLTLEEARGDIVEHLKTTKAQSMAGEEAAKVAGTLRESLKAGKSFADAATAAGIMSKPFENVAPFGGEAPPDLRQYAEAAMVLQPGEIGGFRPGPSGGFVVRLESRTPVDEKQLAEHRDQIVEFIRAKEQNVLFFEWLDHARKEADIRMLGDNG